MPGVLVLSSIHLFPSEISFMLQHSERLHSCDPIQLLRLPVPTQSWARLQSLLYQYQPRWGAFAAAPLVGPPGKVQPILLPGIQKICLNAVAISTKASQYSIFSFLMNFFQMAILSLSSIYQNSITQFLILPCMSYMEFAVMEGDVNPLMQSMTLRLQTHLGRLYHLSVQASPHCWAAERACKSPNDVPMESGRFSSSAGWAETTQRAACQASLKDGLDIVQSGCLVVPSLCQDKLFIAIWYRYAECSSWSYLLHFQFRTYRSQEYYSKKKTMTGDSSI